MQKVDLVEKLGCSYIPEPNSGCWLWTGAVNRKGYGVVALRPEFWSAHRLSYRTFVGDIPPGVQVLHRCDTPACVNPAHLFLGTNAENTADKMAKGRHRASNANGWVRPGDKLSDKAVIEIFMSEEPSIVLAARYGVHRRLITQVRAGHRRKSALRTALRPEAIACRIDFNAQIAKTHKRFNRWL